MKFILLKYMKVLDVYSSSEGKKVLRRHGDGKNDSIVQADAEE